MLQIFIESLSGERWEFSVDLSDSVRSLKSRISTKQGLGIPRSQQNLIYRNTALKDERRLGDYEVVSGATFKLVPAARTGPLSGGPCLLEKHIASANIDQQGIASFLEVLQSENVDMNLDLDDNELAEIMREYRLDQEDAEEENSWKPDCLVGSSNSFSNHSNVEILAPNQRYGKSWHKPSDSDQGDHDLNLSFDDSMKQSVLQRACDNLRTMEKMRDLRCKIEGLQLERNISKNKTKSEASDVGSSAVAKLHNAEPSGKPSHSKYDMLSAKSSRKTIQASTTRGNVSAAAKFKAPMKSALNKQRDSSQGVAGSFGLSYAEDTSAKESSAGETECDERGEHFTLSLSLTSDSHGAAAVNSAETNLIQLDTSQRRNERSKDVQLITNQASPRLGSTYAHSTDFGNTAASHAVANDLRFISSSSDFGFESSAAEKETGVPSEYDELYTADDKDFSDNDDNHYFTDGEPSHAARKTAVSPSNPSGTNVSVVCTSCQLKLNAIPATIETGVDSCATNELIAVDNTSSKVNDRQAMLIKSDEAVRKQQQTTNNFVPSDDWSLGEVSSGLIMCELSETRLRNKVRKRHAQRIPPSRRANTTTLLPLSPWNDAVEQAVTAARFDNGNRRAAFIVETEEEEPEENGQLTNQHLLSADVIDDDVYAFDFFDRFADVGSTLLETTTDPHNNCAARAVCNRRSVSLYPTNNAVAPDFETLRQHSCLAQKRDDEHRELALSCSVCKNFISTSCAQASVVRSVTRSSRMQQSRSYLGSNKPTGSLVPPSKAAATGNAISSVRPRSRPRLAKAASTGGESSSDEPESAMTNLAVMRRENSGFFNPLNASGQCGIEPNNRFKTSSYNGKFRAGGISGLANVNFIRRTMPACGSSRGIRKCFSERTGRSAVPNNSGQMVVLPAVTPPGSPSGFSSDSGFPIKPSGGSHATALTASSYNIASGFAVNSANGTASSALSASSAAVVRQHRLPQSSQSQQRCNACSFKLTIANTFQCRCGKTLCAKHRQAELHGCMFDYKSEGRKTLQKDNPKISHEKFARI